LEADILSLAELRQLRKDQPRKLFNYLKQVERDFVFGVEDHRDEGSAEWGGEFRVLLNRNVELHLVPRFNEEMSDSAELPQFCIMPDSELAGTEDERSIRIDAEDSVSASRSTSSPTPTTASSTSSSPSSRSTTTST